MASATSKTSAIQALLLRAWKDRWSDIEWGIHLRTVLPRGCSGDAYNLSFLILQQALVGPFPNEAFMSFLRHSISAQTVSYASVLEAIVCYGTNGHLPPENNDVSHHQFSTQQDNFPHCMEALLDLIDSMLPTLTSRGKPEECLTLASGIIKTIKWLLSVMVSIWNISEDCTPTDHSNISLCHKIIKTLVDDDFFLSLLYIGAAEDRDSVSGIKEYLNELDKREKFYNSDTECMLVQNCSACFVERLTQLDPFSFIPKCISKTTQVHLVQPILLFEAILRPGADVTSLSHHLHCVATIHGLPQQEFIFEVIRGILLSLSPKEGLEFYKVDNFVLSSLPLLLEKLWKLMKKEVEVDATWRRSEFYEVFQKVLACEGLLNNVDVRCRCNIINIIIEGIQKLPTSLMTDSEIDAIVKAREQQRSASKMLSSESYANRVGQRRNFLMADKATEILKNLITVLDNVDYSKTENLDKMIGPLSEVLKKEDFNIILTTAVSRGLLSSFVRILIKTNQNCLESAGESVKNSVSRMTLFDTTFLILIHIVQCYGSEVVLSEASGTFIETWITDLMIETELRPKTITNLVSNEENNVDSIIQQLQSGEIRTLVVKWSYLCNNIHRAVMDFIVGRAFGEISHDDYQKAMQTVCSKLCALPICVVNLLANWQFSSPGSGQLNFKEIVVEFMDILVKVCQERLEGANITMQPDMSLTREKYQMMMLILSKMRERTGLNSDPPLRLRVNHDEENEFDPQRNFLTSEELIRPLDEPLLRLWKSVTKNWALKVEDVWKLHFMLKTGGPNWFTSCLVRELFNIAYETELDRAVEMIMAIFYLDMEQCCLALMLHVVPDYLQYRTKRNRLIDPHGKALAKLTLNCAYMVLMGIQSQATMKSTPTQGVKRNQDEMSDEITSTKMKRFVNSQHESSNMLAMSYSTSCDDFSSGLGPRQSGSPSDSAKSDELALHPVTLALSGFFELLYKVVTQQEHPVTPCTSFAFRAIEYATIPVVRQYSPKSKLVLQYINTSLVLHMVKTLPHLFSVSFLCKLYDVSTPVGRKNLARVLCQWRNIMGMKKHQHSIKDTNEFHRCPFPA